MWHSVMYQFTDLLVVAIKGHWLGSLDATALQDLERGICIAGGRRRKGECIVDCSQSVGRPQTIASISHLRPPWAFTMVSVTKVGLDKIQVVHWMPLLSAMPLRQNLQNLMSKNPCNTESYDNCMRRMHPCACAADLRCIQWYISCTVLHNVWTLLSRVNLSKLHIKTRKSRPLD